MMTWLTSVQAASLLLHVTMLVAMVTGFTCGGSFRSHVRMNWDSQRRCVTIPGVLEIEVKSAMVSFFPERVSCTSSART